MITSAFPQDLQMFHDFPISAMGLSYVAHLRSRPTARCGAAAVAPSEFGGHDALNTAVQPLLGL